VGVGVCGRGGFGVDPAPRGPGWGGAGGPPPPPQPTAVDERLCRACVVCSEGIALSRAVPEVTAGKAGAGAGNEACAPTYTYIIAASGNSTVKIPEAVSRVRCVLGGERFNLGSRPIRLSERPVRETRRVHLLIVMAARGNSTDEG